MLRYPHLPIQIIAVGKLRESYYHAAAEEYLRRLSRYCRLSVLEVQDEKDPGSLSAALTAKAIEMEGSRILERIKPYDFVVAMCIDGSQYSSVAFSKLIKSWHEQSAGICFVLGGSLGLSEAVLQRANMKVSFSAMTFPHQLARVILLEQVYRAHKLIAGERYHK